MKALVAVGGCGVPAELLRAEAAAAGLILCADGGAAHLMAAGILPHVLVGDMDSIDPVLLVRLEAAGTETVRVNSAKDETDGWLAVDEAIARGATELVLVGALGGRVDHLLGNLMLLVRAARRGVKAVIHDEGCEIAAATGDTEIRGRAGDTVSLLPIGHGVSVRYVDGLLYGTEEPLKLPIDAPVGVSNVMTADVAHVVVEGWSYLFRYFEPEAGAES